mmetsp:Transcript_4217/g.8638  ORF Transcript_4217/g.8638 Transcript_4217/m.8638 type:complete len:207 (-) Transcript_4217:416-1036(-)
MCANHSPGRCPLEGCEHVHPGTSELHGAGYQLSFVALSVHCAVQDLGKEGLHLAVQTRDPLRHLHVDAKLFEDRPELNKNCSRLLSDTAGHAEGLGRGASAISSEPPWSCFKFTVVQGPWPAHLELELPVAIEGVHHTHPLGVQGHPATPPSRCNPSRVARLLLQDCRYDFVPQLANLREVRLHRLLDLPLHALPVPGGGAYKGSK